MRQLPIARPSCVAEARSHRCDVAVAADVDQLAGEVHAEFGAVDVLVNNAGVGVGGPFLAGSLDDWVWLRSVNLDGVVHGCRAFAPAMIERGRGHVVNIASGAGCVPSRRMATYCASKAAVVILSKCLRADRPGFPGRVGRSSGNPAAPTPTSYYFDKLGDVPLRPTTTFEALWRSRHFDLDDYSFTTTKAKPALAVAPTFTD